MAEIRTDSVDCVGAVTSAILYVSPQQNMNIGLGVSIVAGVILATVQFTFDDPASLTAVWYPHPFLVVLAANTAGNVLVSIRGLRLVNTAAGTARLTLLQYI